MSVAPDPVGSTPETDIEVVFLSAMMQATAGTVIDYGTQLVVPDFTPAGAVIFQEILNHAHQAAQQDKNAVMNLPVVNAALTAQGAYSDGHDTGTKALMNEVATCASDPLFLPHLIQALRQQAFRRELAAFKETIAEIDPETIGVSELDTLLRNAQQRLQASRNRLETIIPNNHAGGHLAAV